MSSDREAAVWEAIGGEPDGLKQNGHSEEVVVPVALLNRLVDRVDDLQERVERIEDGGGQAVEGPPLIHYANIPEDDREGLLSTSEQIAVSLHLKWRDIAWKMGDEHHRRIGVDSKTKAKAKYNPSRLKHELKRELDRDFESVEIYRGLRRLAKLSGGKETSDENGRVHITGGLYEYHHRPTIDGQDTKHVLFARTE